MTDIAKDKELILEELLARNENDMVQMEVREKYLIQRAIKEPRYQLELGRLQAEMKEAKEWIAFLKKQ